MSKKTLRQRVSTYFRQLSFINEPRVQISNRRTCEENFLRKYLDGRMPERSPNCPPIQSGRDPQDMPDVEVKCSSSGPLLACTGPEEGLTAIVRSKLHLSAGFDIDFIDNNNLESDFEVRRSKRGNAPRFGGITSAGSGESRFGSTNNRRTSETAKEPSPDNNAASKIALNPGDPETTVDLIAGISNWDSDSEYVCGLSTTLYERNPVSTEVTGSPIADCFAFIAHGDVCLMGLADGVNWGEKACLAARAALRGGLEYLKSAVFGLGANDSTTRVLSTREVFVSLLRSIWEAHGCILEVGGALTTLTIAVVMPVLATADHDNRKWVVCACNVGDSLGFVYSQKYGVREFTEASHDTTSNRDMRDALGALGPVDGTKPELSNLTLSMTEVEEDDIVFLTSDGISDNFDPVVGKFAMAVSDSPDLSDVKTELKVAGGGRTGGSSTSRSQASKSNAPSTSNSRPKLQPLAALTNRNRPDMVPPSQGIANRPQYNRSKTVMEPPSRRNLGYSNPFGSPSATPIHRSPSILPQVSGVQRHKLTLLRLEDLLSYGINGTLQPCNSTRQLCKLLIDFSKMITSAKRSMLEQRESYVRLVTDPGGQRRETELNRLQMRAARKRIVDSAAFQSLPGKLDHATVVGFMCKTTTNKHSSAAQVLANQADTTTLPVIAPRPASVIVTDF